MNSRTARALRRRIRATGVTLSAGAWRLVKDAHERGSRTASDLLRPVRLVRGAKGHLYGLTPAEDRALRVAAVARGARTEPDARAYDALVTATCAAMAFGVLLVVFSLAAHYLTA